MTTKSMESLDDLVRHHVRIRVACPCGHSATLTPSSLILKHRLPAGISPRRLRFRCRACGARCRGALTVDL